MAFTAGLLAAGCASLPQEPKFTGRYRNPSVRRDAVRAILDAQLDARRGDAQSLSWSVLDGVREAFKRGGESREMAVFWIDEVDRRFQARSGATHAALAEELAGMTDAEVAAILATAKPDALRGRSRRPADASGYRYSIESSRAYRVAKVTAQCESLSTAPVAWNAAHPGGPLFDFAANGIDIRQAEHQCSPNEARQ